MRLLHLHSSFSAGGKELRAAKLMNAFGPGIDHVLVSGVPGQLGAAEAIDPAIGVAYPETFPKLSGSPLPWRLYRLAQALRGFDLVLTYNWGAMDAVMAHRLYRRVLSLPPLVHHEDGFNHDESGRLDPRRNAFRRLALGSARALVVPSRQLESIALEVWQVPPGKVCRIANGIDSARYAGTPARAALPGLKKRNGEFWLGTLAGLRAVKNLPRLVRAFAAMPDCWRLVIAGEGPERAVIEAEAARHGVAERVHLPGFVADPAQLVGLFDLFAMSSDSEQFPISLVEAMASGLAVVSPGVGDVAAMVAPENRRWIVARSDEAAFAAALVEAAGDPVQRAAIGRANREKARTHFDDATMIAAYREVYARAVGKADFP